MLFIMIGAVVTLLLWAIAGSIDSISIADKRGRTYLEMERRRYKDRERKLREIERRMARSFHDLADVVEAAAKPVPLTDEDKVLALCEEIQRISDTGLNTTSEPVYIINPDPTDLELDLTIGPAAHIVANQSLIGEIENLWNARQLAFRAAREAKRREARIARDAAAEKRRMTARLVLAERKFKWWHRRALRGLCCASCFGEHPTEVCVSGRFRARRVPSSALSPYDEKLGMYGVREPDPIDEFDSEIVRSWGTPDPIIVKRSPRASFG